MAELSLLVLAGATLVSLCPHLQIPLPAPPAQGPPHWKAGGGGVFIHPMSPHAFPPSRLLSSMATHTTRHPPSWLGRAPNSTPGQP